ncbi:hypothetical protein [Streptosporangium sp. NPDC000396]|uniref:hypothetical protein n=1 Tax=Streptosporangium sp. NPDC000396 TaxID=3366185 RepID=UPI0036ADDB27
MGYPPQYGRPPRGETGRGLAVILIIVTGVLIGAIITMTTALNPPSATSPPETQGPGHSETKVRMGVQPVLDAYSSGSYGDFWDLWSMQAQRLIAREEYVRLFQICPPPVQDSQSSQFTITAVTITGDDARVQATRLNDTTDFTFVFESESWRYVPSLEERQEYQGKAVEQIAEQRRAAGLCGTASSVPTPPAPTATGPAVPTPTITGPAVPVPTATGPAVPTPITTGPTVPTPTATAPTAPTSPAPSFTTAPSSGQPSVPPA